MTATDNVSFCKDYDPLSRTVARDFRVFSYVTITKSYKTSKCTLRPLYLSSDCGILLNNLYIHVHVVDTGAAMDIRVVLYQHGV